ANASWDAPMASSCGTRPPPAEITLARCPASRRAWAISSVERSTPPASSAGSSCRTCSGGALIGRPAGAAGSLAGDVLQHELGTAVHAARPAGGLDRQVHARMRVPQCHLRRRAGQGQLVAADDVAALLVGGGGDLGFGTGQGTCTT